MTIPRCPTVAVTTTKETPESDMMTLTNLKASIGMYRTTCERVDRPWYRLVSAPSPLPAQGPIQVSGRTFGRLHEHVLSYAFTRSCDMRFLGAALLGTGPNGPMCIYDDEKPDQPYSVYAKTTKVVLHARFKILYLGSGAPCASPL